MKIVSGFVAESGDIRCFTNAKQLQKLAGLAIIENSSGKHIRNENTLKKMRSMMVLSNKLIRVIYTILKSDIRRPEDMSKAI